MGKLIFIALLILNSAQAVIPITGSGSLPSGFDFGDPSPPMIYQDAVQVLTTGGHVLSWRTIGDLLRGRPAKLSHLKLHHPDGSPFWDNFGEDIWDPTIKNGVLYGGVMAPRKGKIHAHEDQDAWSRRVYAFKNVQGKWIREVEPLSGPVPEKPTWIGHTYGHHFLEGYMFYEKVTQERHGSPWVTEIFARKVKDSFHLTGPEIPILKLTKDWPKTRRSFGGKLVEGPRPFKVRELYFISFSAGDYSSDDYGIHLMVSKSLLGPYQPYLTPDQKDLADFAAGIEEKLPLTWGGARAAFFEAQGKHWALFHGIKDNGESPAGLRNIWLAPVSFGKCRELHCEVNLR